MKKLIYNINTSKERHYYAFSEGGRKLKLISPHTAEVLLNRGYTCIGIDKEELKYLLFVAKCRKEGVPKGSYNATVMELIQQGYSFTEAETIATDLHSPKQTGFYRSMEEEILDSIEDERTENKIINIYKIYIDDNGQED